MQHRTLGKRFRGVSLSARFAGTIASVVLVSTALTRADSFAALCADRTAVERVYYRHRLGEKPPFEQITPPSLIERLVKDDLHKEAVLKKNYHLEATPALVEAEVRRINATTRAPEVLAEIKAALADDPDRFARAVARPIVVERLLRDKFENDDTLHAARRREMELTREHLLAARNRREPLTNLIALLKQDHPGQVTETRWRLTARPTETVPAAGDDPEIRRRFGPGAQILSPASGKDEAFYFADLPAPLQDVLRAQLRGPGDVSAVIEAPGSFLLYLARQRTDDRLDVVVLSIAKRSYDEWLAEP